MFDVIVVATDGSESVQRAVETALDLAGRFDAAVHALYVVDEAEVDATPEDLREEMQTALRQRGEASLASVRRRADEDIAATIREGNPTSEICGYAREAGADVVAMGTRGRHGANRMLVGSVAERVVRACPVPVLTVRQLADDE